MNFVRPLRQIQRMTLKDLSKKVGVTKGWIQRIESGNTVPTKELKRKIARALRCEITLVFPELVEKPKRKRVKCSKSSKE